MNYYYKSEFELVETFLDAGGDPVDITNIDVSIEYMTAGWERYTVSRIGGVPVNCVFSEAEPAKLTAVFQNHGLNIGVLRREITLFVDNVNFASGKQKVALAPLTSINLVATSGEQGTAEIETILPVVNYSNHTHPEYLTEDSEIQTFETIEKTISGAVNEVRTIAIGATICYVFDTEASMEAWLEIPANVAILQVGNNLLIREVSVPDYWWDGFEALELEVKIDLSNYYNKSEITSLLSSKKNNASEIAISSGNSYQMENNAEYRAAAAITTLTFTSPAGNYECWIRFTTASSGVITVTLPNGIVGTPTIGNSETWEISVKDGIAIALKIA